MNSCPCDQVTEWFPNIPAGLELLPRQPWAFPDVRESLLRGIGTAIPDWLARDPQDLGVMWLEMWAYVSDVLAFYDERIANESYLRTAQLAPSLRRHVEMLGYVPKPGLGGSVVIALEGEGRQPFDIPEKTGFRSEAFGTEPPQVYELTARVTIDPLRNKWEVGAVQKNALPDHPPSMGMHPEVSPALSGSTAYFVFETDNFALAKDRLVVFQGAGIDAPGVVTQATKITPFEGRDGRSYVEVQVEPPVYIPAGTKPDQVRVLTPTINARHSLFAIPDDGFPVTNNRDGATEIYLDSVYRQLSLNSIFIVSTDSGRTSSLFSVSQISEPLVELVKGKTDSRLPVTFVRLSGAIDPKYADASDLLTFHFSFVDGGRVTTVPSLNVTPDDLRYGVALNGVVEAPLSAEPLGVTGKILNREFLLQDANKFGVHVKGSIRFDETGRAVLSGVTAVGNAELPTLTAPITVYGNVERAYRGESVFDEVLGSGDPKVLNQSFQLAQKPLTYLDADGGDGRGRSTLHVRVDGVEWTEVKSFYGTGPEDQVYIVRHDDDHNSYVIFGDGVRGARLTNGSENVRSDYRYGSGRAAPPAGSVNQLARTAPGLAGVWGPIAGFEGRDPEDPKALKVTAPRSTQLLGSAVGIRDFENVALLVIGVVQASAEFKWLPESQQVGVRVSYIGNANVDDVTRKLRDKAEPNLTIEVDRAEPVPSTLELTVSIDPRYDDADVKSDIVKLLMDPEHGYLVPKNAAIGGQFWVSKIYELVLEVPGTVAVESGMIYRTGFSAQPLEVHDVFCAPSGRYYDFSGEGGLKVQPVPPIQAPIAARRPMGEL